MRLQSFGKWLCSDLCLSACRCEGLDFLVYIFDVLLLGPAFCSPVVVSLKVKMFDLRPLLSGCSADIVELTVPWRSICFLVLPNWFLRNEAANDDTMIVLYYCGIPPINWSAMPECSRNVHHLSHLT